MKKANYIYLSGKGFWLHRLFEADEYRGNTFWSMRLYPDPKSWELFYASNLMQKIKEDEEGKFVTLRRYTEKPWKLRAGEDPAFSPPRVTDKDGAEWGTDNLIGNGSGVTVKLEIYKAKDANGARIEGVRVDNWIEYEPPNDEVAVPVKKPSSSAIRPF